MSAIFGIIKKHGNLIELNCLSNLQHAMAHRAIDGKGLWQSEHVAFGFCKLSVYPQQVNDQSPIEADDLVLTADARIDNRDELYNLLGLDKKKWEHRANSHLLLKAYQAWGELCVDKLEGEFIFAVWSKISQKLFIATDHIGFRPLFYYDGPNEFIFCSEIKGVVAAKTTPNYFNDEHLIEYHFRRSDPAKTYNKEVFALCGGNTLILENEKVTIKKYWRLEIKGKYNFIREDDWFECMRHLMYKAVEKRLNPELRIGVTLSGGLDSGSITCILSELLAKKNKPLYTFSSVLPNGHDGIEMDERRYIEIVNKHCPNIIQTYVEASGIGPFDNVEEAFERDEAIPNVFFYMDQAILQAARDYNVRSMFSGFGGDFFASSGGEFVIYSLIRQGDYKMALQLLKQLSKNYNIGLLRLFKRNYLTYNSFWHWLSKLKPRRMTLAEKTVLQPKFKKSYEYLYDFDLILDQQLDMKRVTETGRISRLAGTFANREAWYHIATNMPMFDKELMEFLMDVPIHLFMNGGWQRGLIRQAMRGVLPSEIQFRRDKQPYTPDFARRAINSRDKMDEIINADKFSFVFDKYFSRQMIVDNYGNIKPHAGFGGPASGAARRLVIAGIASKVLARLRDADYIFD
jgi:asparagine synthase (glutamine-hydrolysing)